MCHRKNRKVPAFLLLLVVSISIYSQTTTPLFRLLPSESTGISFSNTITENDTLNILNQANIYNGGGVGAGDFNNDGLIDLYFAGNMVSNKLYINKGSMKFEDHTSAARVTRDGRWCTGVSVVDIIGDGLLIFVLQPHSGKMPNQQKLNSAFRFVISPPFHRLPKKRLLVVSTVAYVICLLS